MSLQTIAIITPVSGKEARLKELLVELAGKVQANEKGVAKYQLFEQYNGQGENVFVVDEIYDSKADHEAHSKTEHFQALVVAATQEGLIAKPLDLKFIKAIAGFASR